MSDVGEIPGLRAQATESLAREQLDGWHSDVVSLILGELVTNALRHGSPPRTVYVGMEPGATLVSVTDSGPGRPRRREPDPSGDGGFGLNLVERLADAWGVVEHDDAKSVWALIPHDTH